MDVDVLRLSPYGDEMHIDLHGYHPADINLLALIEQVWQTRAPWVSLVHGHGRGRRKTVRTGYFGVRIRRALRKDPAFKPYIVRSSLDVTHRSSTYVRLRKNPKPSRTAIDMSLIGIRRYEPKVEPRLLLLIIRAHT